MFNELGVRILSFSTFMSHAVIVCACILSGCARLKIDSTKCFVIWAMLFPSMLECSGMSENEQWDRLCFEIGWSETVGWLLAVDALNKQPKSSPYFLLVLQLKPGKYLRI
jgi:hypothetical protein